MWNNQDVSAFISIHFPNANSDSCILGGGLNGNCTVFFNVSSFKFNHNMHINF